MSQATGGQVRVAVIGVGHLGRFHAKKYAELDGVQLVGVVDARGERAEEVAAECGTRPFVEAGELIGRVDAVSVAVPTSRHADVALPLLAAGIATLIEKPLAASVAEAEKLVDASHRSGAILQVGHIERFNPAWQALPQRADKPILIQAERTSPYPFRSTDVSVVFDLMVHDLDLLLGLLGEPPEVAAAYGWPFFGGRADVAAAQLRFPSGTLALLTAARVDLAASRRMRIFWPDAVAHVDFAAKRLKLAAAEPAVRRDLPLFLYPPPERIAELRDAFATDYFPLIERDCSAGPDQLEAQLAHFINCVRTGQRPLVDGRAALRAVQLAERIEGTCQQQRPALPAAA